MMIGVVTLRTSTFHTSNIVVLTLYLRGELTTFPDEERPHL